MEYIKNLVSSCMLLWNNMVNEILELIIMQIFLPIDLCSTWVLKNITSYAYIFKDLNM